jgi:hypothetical protein
MFCTWENINEKYLCERVCEFVIRIQLAQRRNFMQTSDKRYTFTKQIPWQSESSPDNREIFRCL